MHPLTSCTCAGLGKNLFDEVRYTPDGAENPEFVLNKDPWRSSQILISGENFGCGSSREHAPWALLDFGIRVVVAPSFADIFFNNCFKNGILPIVLPQEQVDSLMEDAAQVLCLFGTTVENPLGFQTRQAAACLTWQKVTGH